MIRLINKNNILDYVDSLSCFSKKSVLASILRASNKKKANNRIGYAQEECYLVYKDKENRVLGGLKLSPSINKGTTLEKYSPYSLSIRNKKIWEVSEIFIDIPSGDPIHEDGHSFDLLVRKIYHMLFNYLEYFSEINGIEILMVVSSEETIKNITYFGNWPLVLCAKLSDGKENEEDIIVSLVHFDERRDKLQH